MDRQLKIIGLVNIGLGLLNIIILGWIGQLTLAALSRTPFILFLPGLLIIGGVGLIIKWRTAWFINQLTSIYVLFAAIAGMTVSVLNTKQEMLGYEETVSKTGQLISFFYGLFILIIAISLIITNKNSTTTEFKVNRLGQFMTLGLATVFSLTIVLLNILK
jgi:hypothetical protein